MRILITGGDGYIGGRLADHFRNKNPELKICLVTQTGNAGNIGWMRDFSVSAMELLDSESIHKCISSNKPDCIIHLAAVNEIASKANPELAWDVNCHGTEKLLQEAYANGVKRFIYFSTFHVYNRGNDSIITEQTPTGSSHPYAETHLAAEKAVESFRDRGMNSIIFRLSNSYGYPMSKEVDRWTLVVNDLCRQAVVNNSIILKSSGMQYRDFIPMCNVVRGVYYFLFNIPNMWGDGIYNLGGNETVPILNMAKKISKIYYQIYNKKVEVITHAEDGKTGPTEPFTYSIDKLLNTGFRLEKNGDQEIANTIRLCHNWFENCDMA